MNETGFRWKTSRAVKPNDRKGSAKIMIKKLRPYFGIILVDTFLFALIIVALHFGLAIFKLRFRKWVYDVSYVLAILGFFAGMIQLLLKIRRPKLRILLMTLCIFIYFYAAMFVTLTFVWEERVPGREFVTEKDGKKYVVTESSFLKQNLAYYDYKGFLVSGNVVRIAETYKYGSYEHGASPLRVSYFDDNGD